MSALRQKVRASLKHPPGGVVQNVDARQSTKKEEPPRSLFLSYLYVPGHQSRRIERAYSSEADAVVLDLEDGVPDSKKKYAREMVSEVLAATTAAKPTFVRINSVASGLCTDDVRAVAGPSLQGLRLPKVNGAGDLSHVLGLLAEAGHPARVHLLLESAAAVEKAYPLAIASPAVTMLGLGESDLRVDLGCDLDGRTMDAARIRVIMASRAAGLPNPCQSVYAEVRDPEGLRASCIHGKQLGFLGRMAIHPDQLPIIHQVYRPTADEIAEAVDICQAADLADAQDISVVVSHRQRLVAPPIVANARRVLDLARTLDLLPDVT
ncbi:HpcH/HpaI aldolase/citrate lyase family protein [Streptomyces coeruleorubidus]|uniref:HpcH/HpaI aldolase/citrate lyase family protein n=1 Tax=Streptomyces coeruleorubidus TaxID=116188 RepID=UPI00340773C8